MTTRILPEAFAKSWARHPQPTEKIISPHRHNENSASDHQDGAKSRILSGTRLAFRFFLQKRGRQDSGYKIVL
jgi:hypothetical protein